MAIGYKLTKKQKRYIKIKRVMDLIICGCAGIVLSPVMLILAIAIKLDSPGSVFFRQTRVTKGKEHFEILKLRTMRIDTPKNTPTHLLKSPDQYITKVGRFLRKYSLDELPQIYQVAAGTLSLVSPRPALWNQYDLIEERDKYGVNSIIPGITGLAQIRGRDELEIAEKARLDGEYVENLSFAMDVKCILGTIIAVIRHNGVVEGGTGEMYKKEASHETVNK